jgi:hypothetical protein
MTYTDTKDIHRRAKEGDADAQMTLARVFDQEGRHDVALEWLRKAAQSGHAPSLMALGARLLVGKAAPQDVAAGVALLIAGAEAGSGEAAALASVCAAVGVGRAQSMPEALDFLQLAAELGHWRSREQLVLLAPDPAHRRVLLDAAPAMPIPWKDIRDSISVRNFLVAAPHEKVELGPRIAIYRNFLPPAFCDWVVGRAQPKLSAARVVDPLGGAGFGHDMRSNTGMGFSLVETDFVLQLINARVGVSTGIRMSQHEPINVLHYAVGQSYAPHYDFLNPDVDQLGVRAQREGQRIGTFLIYLNSEFEGGETEFPELKWRFRGQKGDALFFVNVTEDGAVDRRLLHAGLAPTRGEKWLLSKWMRDRDMPVL